MLDESALDTSLSRRDLLLLGLLLVLVLPLHCWLLYNTEVTARDSIGYIRYALAFEKLPWDQVFKGNDQHPGYPLALWATSVPVRWYAGETTPEVMRVSAQLVSLGASLLLLVPMYGLGRCLLGPAVAFWGCLLFQYWPVSAHHLSDGISETLFLLLLVTALLNAVHGVHGRVVWRLALCGLFSGLAYVTRPEGALVVPAAGLVLVAQQCLPRWRVGWGRWLACGTALSLTALLVGSVYVAATGRLTNKLSALQIINTLSKPFSSPVTGIHADEPRLASIGDIPLLLAATYKPTDKTGERLGHSSMALVAELNQGFHYVGSIPALLGLWWIAGLVRRKPGFWVLSLYAVFHAAVLVALAMVVFYVSDRHIMSLVMLGSFLVAYGLREMPRRLFPWTDETATLTRRPLWRSAPAWTVVLSVGVIAFGVPGAMQRLHANRAANREAGLWLKGEIEAGHIRPDLGDMIVDDHYWSHFYAGQVIDEGKNDILPKGVRPTCYVVVTCSKEQDERRDPPREGQVVHHWPEMVELDRARVIIYARPRDKRHPWQER